MFSSKPLHSFHLSTNVENITEIHSVEDLKAIDKLTNSGEFIVIGEGSNTIFIDDYLGTIVLNKLVGTEIKETDTDYIVSAGSGVNWNDFVLWCLNQGIYGLENLALIPGTVGASPIQNIGAYGVEVNQFIQSVEYFDLVTKQIHKLDNLDCNFGYRDSVFKHELKNLAFISKVTFCFPKAWQPKLSYAPLDILETPSAMEIYKKVCETRNSKLPDPSLIGNAGSFFKNPIISNEKAVSLHSQFNDLPSYVHTENSQKIAAGWLIDKAGLKGFTLGNVAVHDKQALVLTNKTGAATGKELVKLASHVMKTVYEQFGIVLEPEVRFVSRHGEVKFNEVDDNIYG